MAVPQSRVKLLFDQGPSETDIAWLAGLIDGEGHISIMSSPVARGSSKKSHGLRIRIAMVHRETIEHIQSLFGGNVNRRVKNRGPATRNHKDAFEVGWYSSHAARILYLIKPYIFTKRAELEIALRFASSIGTKTLSFSERDLLRQQLSLAKGRLT